MTPTFNTHPDALYLCDNGACYCGEHLGSSAKYTGRDISGQRIHRITQADARESARDGFPLTCERCAKGWKRIFKRAVA